MGVIGFGGYRISIRSKEHKEALVNALKAGIKLIDTSSNYTNGESEQLIGTVLKDYPEYQPIIVTKAGYIQGENLNHIVTDEDLVVISDHLKHSIHPQFLEDQLSRSLSRLQKDSVDVFLLHNPEYFFQTENSSADVFYQRIKKAFVYLEEEVKNHRIKAYGISSNHFILPKTDSEWVSLEKVLEIANSISKDHHFKYIQFPLNLIEIGALEKFGEFPEMSLLEMAKLNNLITISNRPLNAFSQNSLVRLATYSEIIESLDEEKAEAQFNLVMKTIEAKWLEEHQKDGEAEIEKLEDVTLIKQFKDIWKQLPSPDSVDQVYFGNLFPFVAQIWGGNLTVEESQPFYELYEFSQKYSRKNLDSKARKFRDQAISVGLIEEINERDFAKEVIATYLNYGIDYVLVGMKKTEYVDQLKSLF